MKSPSSRTYILPTAYGVSFAAVCILLLAVAFASTNNAVYFLCFVMSSLGIQSLVITNRNIEKLEVTGLEIPDFFADESGFAMVSVHNSMLQDAKNIRYEFGKETAYEIENLRPGERRQVRIAIAKKPAGQHAYPKLKISSDFPFFFSRSWKTYQAEGRYHVYPPRRGNMDFSPKAFFLRDADASTQDEFKGHRDYRDNDSPRSIDWKVTSRLQKMTVKEHDNQSNKKIWLRWQDCKAASTEDRKAQMSLWIDLADKKEFEYGIMLPDHVIEFNRGPQHKTACLRALL